MIDVIRTLRYALRQLRQAPVFTAAAVITLALGIGGTTAIFTLIHAVMLRSLPVSDPARLYRIGEGDDCCVEGGPQERWGMFSFPLYERLKAAAPEFEEIAAFQAGGARSALAAQACDKAAGRCGPSTSAATISRRSASGAFGGRMLTATDDKPASPPVAVISHHAWQRRTAATHGGGVHARRRRASVHGHRRRPAWVLRRNPARRSARGCGSRCSRSRSINGDGIAAAAAGLSVAARDRAIAARRDHRTAWRRA